MTYAQELTRTVERMRQLSEPRLLPHESEYRAVLGALTDRAVPRIEPRAWADQLQVIGREVAPDRAEIVVERLIELRRCFDLTPS